MASQDWSGTTAAYSHFEKFSMLFAGDAVQALVQSTDLSKGNAVLIDVACGSGAATFMLADALAAKKQSAKIVASDMASGMLEKLTEAAKTRGIPVAALGESAQAAEAGVTIETLQADMQDHGAAIPDGSIDGLLCTFGIMFPPDPMKAAKDMHRMLKPGATGVIVTWHYYRTFDLINEIAIDQGKIQRNMTDYIHITPEWSEKEILLRRLFAEAGFTKVEVSFSQHSGVVPTSALVGSLNTNPSAAKFGPWDLEQAEKTLARFVNADGALDLRGTAVVVRVMK